MSARASVVVFDIGNVLIEWDPRHLYRRLIPDDAEREHFLRHHCTPAWNFLQDLGRPWAEAEAEAIALAPHKADLIRAFRAHWLEMVPGAIEANVRLLEDLRGAGVPVFAITNFAADTLVEASARYPFLTRFQDCIVSGVERLAKPDPAIFQLLLDRHGLNPENCIFLDDSAPNIATAAGLGFSTVHFSADTDARAAFRRVGLPV